MHRLVAEKVRVNVGLLDSAGAILEHWYRTVSPRTFVYLDEWQTLLNQGADAVLAVACEDSQHAAALRQASPLACLLTHQERFAFLKTWREQHAPH
jgi:hypothetical protein